MELARPAPVLAAIAIPAALFVLAVLANRRRADPLQHGIGAIFVAYLALATAGFMLAFRSEALGPRTPNEFLLLPPIAFVVTVVGAVAYLVDADDIAHSRSLRRLTIGVLAAGIVAWAALTAWSRWPRGHLCLLHCDLYCATAECTGYMEYLDDLSWRTGDTRSGIINAACGMGCGFCACGWGCY